MESIAELFEQVTSPGDAATVLLAGTLGLVADAGLNVVGFLSPGSCGVVAASTALGVKKGMEARRARGSELSPAQRATKILGLAVELGLADVSELKNAIELHEQGVLSDAALSLSADELLAKYRDSPLRLLGPGANLQGMSLAGSRLHAVDLTGAALTGADLTGAVLSNATIADARLTNTVFGAAVMRQATLRGSTGRNINFADAKLDGADLSNVDAPASYFRRANLDGANLSSANFEGGSFQGASLREAVLTGAILHEAILSDADLTGCNLANASLTGAELGGVTLDGADLTNCDLTGAAKLSDQAKSVLGWGTHPSHYLVSLIPTARPVENEGSER